MGVQRACLYVCAERSSQQTLSIPRVHESAHHDCGMGAHLLPQAVPHHLLNRACVFCRIHENIRPRSVSACLAFISLTHCWSLLFINPSLSLPSTMQLAQWALLRHGLATLNSQLPACAASIRQASVLATVPSAAPGAGTDAQDASTKAGSSSGNPGPSELASHHHSSGTASTSGSSTVSEVLRQHNLSGFAPGKRGLKGKMVLAKVLSVNSKEILVDALYGVSSIPRQEIDTTHLHQQADDRRSTADVRPGDLLKLRVVEPFTPYGSTLLAPVQKQEDAQQESVWSELHKIWRSSKPVQGRVLNPCAGGYAVGVAGLVALLPYSAASEATVRRVGELQSFYITRMDAGRRRIELSDPNRSRRFA